MSMDEAARIGEAIWFGIWSIVAILLFFYLTHRSEDEAPMRCQRWWWAFCERYFALNGEDEELPMEDNVDELITSMATPDNQIAIPQNSVNTVLIDKTQALFQGKIEALAMLVNAGKVGQTEGLELVFQCSRSSRTDSPYHLARIALLPLITHPVPRFPALTEEQQQAREDLGLTQ